MGDQKGKEKEGVELTYSFIHSLSPGLWSQHCGLAGEPQ